MTRLNIGIDMDGVLANWHDAAVQKINELWDLEIKEIPTFDTGGLVQRLLAAKNITISKSEVYSQLCDPGFFRNLEPIGDIYNTVKELYQYGDIYIVTKPTEWSYVPGEKYEWLKEHLKDIPYKLIVTQSSEAKGLFQLDIMIDDDPRVREAFKKKRVCVFMPRGAWNLEYIKNEPEDPEFIVVETINEVPNIIKSYL